MSGKTDYQGRGKAPGVGFFRCWEIIFPLLILSPLICFIATAFPVEEQIPAQGGAQCSEKWGIEPVSLRLTAAGQMIDFRYKITDPNKAAPFFYSQNKPALIDQTSGKKLSVPVAPKVGSLRQKTVKPEIGRIYFILFGNPGVVKDGSKVTLIVGDIRIENLTVEGEPPRRTQ